VRAGNDELARNPGFVNSDPYGQGWMFEIEMETSTLDRELAELMDGAAYRHLAGT